MTKTSKIFIAGDSTAAIKQSNKRPETGWGEKLALYISNFEIVNKAKNGRSTKSFINEGLLAEIDNEIEANDYLFIQFGHNDQKKDEDRGTQPYGDYQENLAIFVESAQKVNAIPILLTSITRRAYLNHSNQLDPNTLGDYPEAMRKFAKKNNILLLDMFKRTQEFFQLFSVEETKKFFMHLLPGQNQNYPNGISDDTHLNNYGATIVAKLVAEELGRLSLPPATSVSFNKNN